MRIDRFRFAATAAALAAAAALTFNGATGASATSMAMMPSDQLGSASASTTSPDTASDSAPRKPCDYVWGTRCVRWVTTIYSCHNIVQITTDKSKHVACAIFADKNIVTVWW